MIAAYRWDSNWKIFLLVLCLLPLLLRLGFWQLERAAEKEQILARYDARQALAPAAAGTINLDGDAAQLAGLPVSIEGRYDGQRHFLLDNRVQAGQAGYEVLTPMTDQSGRTWLVNRGWIPGFADRRRLPEFETPDGELSVVGNVYVPAGEPILLEDDIWAEQWPRVIQSVDMRRVADSLTGPIMPYQLRIAAGQPGALQVSWQQVNLSPAKHTGYAVQWFTMAIALVLFWIYSSIKKVDDE